MNSIENLFSFFESILDTCYTCPVLRFFLLQVTVKQLPSFVGHSVHSLL